MKKMFLSLSILLILAINVQAQFILDSGDLLDGLFDDGIVYFQLTPVAGNDTTVQLDAGFCLGPDTIKVWSDYSCQLRVREDIHYFDARNEGGPGNYMCVDTLYWEYDKAYHCWMDIHLSYSTYDVYVLPVGSPVEEMTTVAIDAAYRKEAFLLSMWAVLGLNDPEPAGHLDIADMQFVTELTIPETGVETSQQAPVDFALEQNYPNPFNPVTTISYSLPVASDVQLTVYDVMGHEVANVVSGKQSVGNHQINFNAANLSSGVYYYQLKAGANIQTKKMMLIK